MKTILENGLTILFVSTMMRLDISITCCAADGRRLRTWIEMVSSEAG